MARSVRPCWMKISTQLFSNSNSKPPACKNNRARRRNRFNEACYYIKLGKRNYDEKLQSRSIDPTEKAGGGGGVGGLMVYEYVKRRARERETDRTTETRFSSARVGSGRPRTREPAVSIGSRKDPRIPGLPRWNRETTRGSGAQRPGNTTAAGGWPPC